MVEYKHVIALYTLRCFAGMQPANLWRVCKHMASPKNTVPGFQKLAKELRAGELWWYHFGHLDMPFERIHPSRRMLLPCKPPAFSCYPDSVGRCEREPGGSVMTDFSVTPSSLSLLGPAESRVPCDADQLDLGRRSACWIFRNSNSLLMIGATLPHDVQGTQPPPRHPKIYHFVRAGLCTPEVQHNDPF